MITVRQIDRLWNARLYSRLFRELLAARPEASLRLEMELGRSIPAAALAVIRLDELTQSYVPLYSKLLRAVLNEQQSDGGWGDTMTTALCVRALACGQGNGIAIQGGLQFLSQLQKPEGIWPAIPLRRMPGEAYASAFILLQLGDQAEFRDVIRLDQAINWFEMYESSLDPETHKLWDRARIRCGGKSTEPQAASLWI